MKRAWRHKAGTLLMAGLLLTAPVQASPVALTLEESVRMALNTNPTVKMAVADREKASGALRTARGGAGPSLDFAHGDKRTKNAAGTIGETYSNSLSVSYSLYSGGYYSGKVEQAKKEFSSSELGVDKALQQIKLDATNGYYSVLQTRNVVVLKQESVDRLQAHLKNVQAQFSVGTVAKVDVLRSEVELAQAEQDLIKAHNAYDLAVASLNNVIGLPLGTELDVREQLAYAEDPRKLDECIAFALANRPEVLQAQNSVDAAKAGVKVAKSGRLPSVSLSGSEGWSDDTFPGDEDNTWSIGLQTNFNVFDAGVTSGQIKQADAVLLKAQESQRQTRDSVQLNVRNAYLNLREAEKRIATSQVAVVKAEEDYKIAQVRYQAGVGTNIDVIDSQVALTTAKTNYVQALYDYNTSRAELDKAMGIAVTIN